MELLSVLPAVAGEKEMLAAAKVIMCKYMFPVLEEIER